VQLRLKYQYSNTNDRLLPVVSQLNLIDIVTLSSIKIHFNTILLPHCLPSDLFPSDLPIKIVHAIIVAPMRATCLAHPIFIGLVFSAKFSEEFF
jgi:hypothetical protein